MEKRRISRILARADGAAVKRLADEIKAVQSPVIVKAPEKSLAMIRMREPVQESLFYLGEVIVCEAIRPECAHEKHCCHKQNDMEERR